MPVSIQEKVGFLKDPRAYGAGVKAVDTIETHMSWIFLTKDRVFKLKKPVQFPFLDFTRLSARERNCLEELRLNRRLAPDIYLRVVPLTRTTGNLLHLDGSGEVVDWLVEMRRLPADRMLDVLLADHKLAKRDLRRLVKVLGQFYASAERPAMEPSQVIESLKGQQALNRGVLANSQFDVDRQALDQVLAAIDQALVDFAPEIGARVTARRFVEGHGDLRPEHVCFSEPLAIFDCLEFNRDLRLLDPFDELAFLGMECAFLGATEFADQLFAQMKIELADDISPRLFAFYAAFRATMRARLSLGHLHYGSSDDRKKWEAKTDKYIHLAQFHLRRIAQQTRAVSTA